MTLLFESSTLSHLITKLHDIVILSPIRRLYLHGPTCLGMWGGQALPDICAYLSRADSSFWSLNIDACHDMVEKKLTSYSVALEAGLYSFILYRTISAWIQHYTLIRPLLREIRNIHPQPRIHA